MRAEYAGRYPDTVWHIIQLSYYNVRHELFGGELRMYFLTLVIIIVLTIGFFIYKRKKDVFFITPILFSFFWILSEFHKLPMHYLPNRYLLGLIAACGILISALISELMLTKKNYIHVLVFSLSATLITLNLFNDYKIFQRRTFHLQQANDYLSKYKFGKDPVIGAWASSLCWKNEAITIPVWNHYFNWQDPINKYHPRIVISEKNESDSDSTYYFQNIKLNSLADSTKEFDLWRTKVMLYWINKK